MQQHDYSNAYDLDKIPKFCLMEIAVELYSPLTLIFHETRPAPWWLENMQALPQCLRREHNQCLQITDQRISLLAYVLARCNFLYYALLEKNKILSDVKHDFHKRTSC